MPFAVILSDVYCITVSVVVVFISSIQKTKSLLPGLLCNRAAIERSYSKKNPNRIVHN